MTSPNDPLFVAFSIVVGFATWIVFLRFLFQLAEVDKKHPYALPIYRLSAIVDVFARLFPNLNQGRVSLSALFLLWLLKMIGIAGKASILAKTLSALELFFGGTMFGVALFFNALKWTVLASVIASFVVMFSQKIHPAVDIAMQLSEPLVAPFRKINLNMGMLDLAPLLAMLGYGLLASAIEIVALNILAAL